MPADSAPAATVAVKPLSTMAAMLWAISPWFSPPPRTAVSTISQNTRSRRISAADMPGSAGAGFASAAAARVRRPAAPGSWIRK